MVDLSTDIVIDVMWVEEVFHSENRSYILSNDTIASVDEDIENYLKGTLEPSSDGELY